MCKGPSRRALLRAAAIGSGAVIVPGIGSAATAAAAPAMRHLPGELSADEVLDGRYPFPPSPAVPRTRDGRWLDIARLGSVPDAGIHPRILFSAEDLPDMRARLAGTETGRRVHATARRIIASALFEEGNWGATLFAAMSGGRLAEARQIIRHHGGLPPAVGHYKPWLYAIVLESLDALIADDRPRMRRAARAVASYAALVGADVRRALASPLNDDVWRVKVSGSRTGADGSNQGVREVVGYHLLGYAYDFTQPAMTADEQRTVRRLIADITAGRIWEGARLPHHFRNWNHILVALSQPLLALAIEGEEGYDPRLFRLGVEMAGNYLDHSLTDQGMSNEAIGYIEFGFVWGNPFLVAAARRGQNLLDHGRYRALADWYCHSLTPDRRGWVSRGDGGDVGPSPWTMAFWLRFFPGDPRVRYLWTAMTSANRRAWTGDHHLVETLIWADDLPEPPPDGAALGLPLSLFEPARGSLIARTGWDDNDAMVTFETRTDSHCASHEHADRGSFTFHALGRTWAKENNRSVETRHHNSVLIDGKGQGYWPGPGEWLHFFEDERHLVAVTDNKPAYDWQWPKQILTEADGFIRFRHDRWTDFREQARQFRARHPDARFERDDRPAVRAFWEGYEFSDPRMWDEDGWPVRMAFNPVEKAKRTILFRKGASPWLIVADDIRKDGGEHLFEWLMQTGRDTEAASIDRNRVILCDPDGNARSGRRLLVEAFDLADPGRASDYHARPSIRLESFERRDTLEPYVGTSNITGSRSYGLDRRLVIASRSVEPRFKILLFPLADGAALPRTEWDADTQTLLIARGGNADHVTFDEIHGTAAIRVKGD